MTCTHAPGRAFPSPLVREMLRAFGIVTCPVCHEALRIIGRTNPRGLSRERLTR